ncbi:Probable transcriptional regulatory protein HI_0315 [Mannheimia haemolytica]|uniref:Probable transcriptional regulatory protein HI_0315 n=1 Tax=Mannheimia haemolytica TaxID=75985 RepID=A0A378MWA8_MANHA|nr:Probable transcriptional regulatory protein HI_0315 [Mannheimia haemolytica]
MKDGIEAAGFKIENAEVTMIPSTTVELDAETAPKLLDLINRLEDCDDVQNVYHNVKSVTKSLHYCNKKKSRKISII